MHARHRQGGDVHGHTTVQVQGADEEEKPSEHNRPADGNEAHVIRVHTSTSLLVIEGYNFAVSNIPNHTFFPNLILV